MKSLKNKLSRLLDSDIVYLGNKFAYQKDNPNNLFIHMNTVYDLLCLDDLNANFNSDLAPLSTFITDTEKPTELSEYMTAKDLRDAIRVLSGDVDWYVTANMRLEINHILTHGIQHYFQTIAYKGFTQ